VWSPGVPLTPLKHAFDLFSKDKKRQRYKNPFLLLSKVHVGQSGRERRKEKKLVAITSNSPPLMAYKIKNLREKEFWAIWGQLLRC